MKKIDVELYELTNKELNTLINALSINIEFSKMYLEIMQRSKSIKNFLDVNLGKTVLNDTKIILKKLSTLSNCTETNEKKFFHIKLKLNQDELVNISTSIAGIYVSMLNLGKSVNENDSYMEIIKKGDFNEIMDNSLKLLCFISKETAFPKIYDLACDLRKRILPQNLN